MLDYPIDGNNGEPKAARSAKRPNRAVCNWPRKVTAAKSQVFQRAMKLLPTLFGQPKLCKWKALPPFLSML